MKKNKEAILDIVIISIFFLSVFAWLLDMVYHDYFYCDCLWKAVCRIEEVLAIIGFEEQRAAALLNGSLGLVMTMVTFSLTIGVNLFNRKERKIYGIPYEEISGYYCSKHRKMSYIISWLLPVFIVIAINMKLYGTSYLLLFCCYVMIIYNYGNYGRSFDKEEARHLVIERLVKHVGNGGISDEQLMDYDAMIDDIRRYVWEFEGWSNAWLFLNDLTKRIMMFDEEQSYILACHLWDAFFTKQNTEWSVLFVRKFIEQMEDADDKYEKKLIIFWSLLCSVGLKWNSKILKDFLQWFTNRANYAAKHILIKEAGMLLLLLEYWFYLKSSSVEIKHECAEKIYEYGKKMFLEKKYIEFLAYLYQQQYEIEAWNPGEAAQILCIDIRYNLKNGLLWTELNI